MTHQFEAVFENGVFRPLGPVDFAEHQRVTLQIPESKDAADGAPSTGPTMQPEDAELLGSQEPWTEEKNERRCDLIDKEIEGTITNAEAIELKALQSQAIAHRDRVAPLPIESASKLHEEPRHDRRRKSSTRPRIPDNALTQVAQLPG